MSNPINRKFGWKKDKPDPRDYKYKVSKPALTLPPYIDLRQYCSPIEDQGELGSCTGQAIVGHLELLQSKNNAALFDISRLFIYYNERLVEGTVSEDSGASIRDGIQTLNCYGFCSEALWPYDVTQFAIKPTEECYNSAIKNIISSYHRLEGLHDYLTCLAEGYPFVFGITLYDSFQSPEVASTGLVPMPEPDYETQIGGHAVLGVGYNMDEQVFIVRNSWGEGWGDKGYFKLPFKYLQAYADDFWTIRK